MNEWEIDNTLGGEVIAFKPLLARLVKSVTAGLFMSQALYWSKRTKGDRWFYKTALEWHQETMLSKRELEGARQVWRDLGVLHEKREGLPARLYYKIDYSVLGELISGLQETDQRQDLSERDAQIYRNDKTGFTETINHTEQRLLTETTTERKNTDPQNVHTHEHDAHTYTQEAAVIEKPRELTPAVIMPLYVQMGKKPTDSRGLSLAPDSVRVTQATLSWWQDHHGWRGDLASLQDQVDACLDWAHGKNERKADWEGTIRNWLRRARKDGDDIMPTQVIDLAREQRGNYNGKRGQGTSQAGTYGYDAQGRPTTKSTQLRSTFQQLAERQHSRNLAEQAGTDTSSFSDGDGSLS